MPFSDNSSLPKNVQGLPEAQQTKWRKVFNAAYEGTCKDRGDKRDECASKIAWSQIDDKYKGNSLVEFSLVVKASFDDATGEMRWKASGSDTDEDSYGDNMSLELFQDFLNRIQQAELAPEDFRSDFWQGGMPYLSVSHYPDLNGDAVPGVIDAVYIDGKCLKSKGRFNDTPLGHACFKSIKEDADKEQDEKVRISIAFLDWKHKHKSKGNYLFERESLDDICPECIRELIKGEYAGKVYLSGQLVHEAMTRVPVNKRTSMEVEKSMTTRKDDAKTIVGEELAEELEEKAKLVGKSEALVIKAEDEETCECGSKLDANGKCPKCDKEDKAEKKSEVDAMAELKAELSEIKSMLHPAETVLDEIVSHPLDVSMTNLKAKFDEAVAVSNLTPDERLQLIQGSLNELGEAIKEKVSAVALPPQTVPVVSSIEATVNSQEIAVAFSEALKPLYQRLDLMANELAEAKRTSVNQPVVPQRTSIAPSLIQQQATVVKSSTPKIRALIEKTT